MNWVTAAVLLSMLSGCMSASWHKSRMEAKVETCAAVGVNISSAAKCLEGKGIFLKRNEHMLQHYYYYSCGPYWGYPLVKSCGNVQIFTNTDGVIESWEVDGAIERIHA